MVLSPRVYVQIWTPPGNDLVLAIIVRVNEPEGTCHFEAEVTTDRIEVETVAAQTLEELEALLAARYGEAPDRRGST